MYVRCSSVYNNIMIEGYVGTKEAQAIFGLSSAHIRRLLASGRINGIKFGRDWIVERRSLERYMQHPPKPGPKPRRKE